MENWIYKILRPHERDAALENKSFLGAPIDVADGYIHFSTRAQLQETADKHFANERRIYILAFHAKTWAPDVLKWEPSRGGALFPHLYAPLDISLTAQEWFLEKDGLEKDGAETFNLSSLNDGVDHHV